MPELSAADQTLMRTYPQETTLYLSIYQPSIALRCRVNGAYDATDQTVAYDGVVSGSYTNITSYSMQVALVGTSEGADDVGRTWVRSATSNELRFVESDHIDWADNLYITVLKYTEIVPVFPRIIQDGFGSGTVTFYKIWDVAYTNQNTVMGNIINMGSHYAGWTGDEVYWSVSGTTNLNGDAIGGKTIIWNLEGGTPSYYSGSVPGDVTYSTPGHYRTTLTITDSDGESDISYRYVSIYDRPGQGSKPPITDWSLTELGGSVDAAGWTCRVRVRQDVPDTVLYDNALVIIFSDEWYGNTNQSLPKNDLGRSHIKFVGYVDGDTIQQNYKDNWVEFSAISPTKIMEMCECFSVSVESKATPATWYEVDDMTVKRAIYHYLRWHSTVLMCSDLHLNFIDRNIQYFDSDRTSLYDAVNSLMDGEMLGWTISDRLGGIYMFRNPNVLVSRTSALFTAMSITNNDWSGDPVIDERQMGEVSFIEMGGIDFSLTDYSSVPLLAAAPGVAPSYHGTVERIQGLALEDQAELNTLVGDLYADKNARFPRNEFRLRTNASHLDIAPPSLFKITMAADDTPRGYTWSEKSFYIRGISERWDAAHSIELLTVSLYELTDGFDGATIIIPVVPPDITTNGKKKRPRPPDPPGWPPIQPPTNAVVGVIDTVVAIAADVRTGDILSVTPTWTTEY